VTRRLSNIKRS